MSKKKIIICFGSVLLMTLLAIFPVMAETDIDNGHASKEGISAQAIEGRYEGTEKKEGENTKYLIAIEIGPGGFSRNVKAYLQIGGVLPTTPTYDGNGFFLGPIGIFEDTDVVGSSKFSMLILGNKMIMKRERDFTDPAQTDYTTSGVLTKVQ